METPGVSTRPILLISGSSPFCETFFDDVKVPKEQIVGEVNRGWDVAKYLLGHEREMIAGMGLATGGSSVTLGGTMRPTDPFVRADIAAFDVDALAFAAMSERFAAMWKAGEAHQAAPSMMKYAGTELNKRRNDLAMATGGAALLNWTASAPVTAQPLEHGFASKGNSIEGGTSEIQLDIVAKHILGLSGGQTLSPTTRRCSRKRQRPSLPRKAISPASCGTGEESIAPTGSAMACGSNSPNWD